MPVQNNNYDDIEIPDFMQRRTAELQRQEHLRRMQEEELRLKEQARKRRMALKRQAEIKRMREIKRRRQKALKIIIGGVVIVVFSNFMINGLANAINGNGVEPSLDSGYSIVQIQEGNNLLPEEENYTIGDNAIISEPEEVIIKVDMSYDARMASIDTSGTFAVGSELNEYVINKMDNNAEIVQYILKYGEMYGVDPYILMAKAMQESSFNHNSCLPGGANYNGYGMGIMQHEKPDGRKIVAYNYQTGQEDVVRVTFDNAMDLEMNIKMGAMHFQNCLKNNNGNLLLALQSYNYGQGMINSILNRYGKEQGLTPEEIMANYSDIGWLEYVTDAHNNAWRYIGDWNGYYGDANYIKNVLRYFVGNEACYYYDGEQVLFDLNTFELTKVTENMDIITK